VTGRRERWTEETDLIHAQDMKSGACVITAALLYVKKGLGGYYRRCFSDPGNCPHQSPLSSSFRNLNWTFVGSFLSSVTSALA